MRLPRFLQRKRVNVHVVENQSSVALTPEDLAFIGGWFDQTYPDWAVKVVLEDAIVAPPVDEVPPTTTTDVPNAPTPEGETPPTDTPVGEPPTDTPPTDTATVPADLPVDAEKAIADDLRTQADTLDPPPATLPEPGQIQ